MTRSRMKSAVCLMTLRFQTLCWWPFWLVPSERSSLLNSFSFGGNGNLFPSKRMWCPASYLWIHEVGQGKILTSFI